MPSQANHRRPRSPLQTAPQQKATDDPFVGDYIGTVHPLGTYGGKSGPEGGKDFKPQKCESCHAEATIERSGAGYSLVMLVEHGKDKDGKLKTDRYTLKADRHDKTLSFPNGAWSITVAGGEASGNRLGLMAAEIKLTQKTAIADKPAGDDFKLLAPGLEYRHDVRTNGPLSIHVLRMDRQQKWDFETGLGQGTIFGLEPLDGIVARVASQLKRPAVAAINGDFFVIKPGPYQGDPRGLQIAQGELVSRPMGSSFGSPPAAS